MRITINCILLLTFAIACDSQYDTTTQYAAVTTPQSSTGSGGVTPCGPYDDGKNSVSKFFPESLPLDGLLPEGRIRVFPVV